MDPRVRSYVHAQALDRGASSDVCCSMKRTTLHCRKGTCRCKKAGIVLTLPHMMESATTGNKDLVEDLVDCHGITDVDDEALLVTATSNGELYERTMLAPEIVNTSIESFGLCVNWTPNKTETMMLWREPYTRSWKRSCLVDGEPALRVPGGSLCPIVTEYKHLGFLTSDRPTLNELETQSHKHARFCVASQTCLPKQDLQPATETSVVPFPGPLCVFHGADLWKLSEPQFRRANAFYMECIQKISGFPRHPVNGENRPMTNEQVRQVLDFPSADPFLQPTRMCHAGPPSKIVLSLLEANTTQPRSWSKLLLHV